MSVADVCVKEGGLCRQWEVQRWSYDRALSVDPVVAVMAQWCGNCNGRACLVGAWWDDGPICKVVCVIVL